MYLESIQHTPLSNDLLATTSSQISSSWISDINTDTSSNISSSLSISTTSDESELSLKVLLANWATKNYITMTAINDLLKILIGKGHTELPHDLVN